jgi:hypothetical protein
MARNAGHIIKPNSLNIKHTHKAQQNTLHHNSNSEFRVLKQKVPSDPAIHEQDPMTTKY